MTTKLLTAPGLNRETAWPCSPMMTPLTRTWRRTVLHPAAGRTSALLAASTNVRTAGITVPLLPASRRKITAERTAALLSAGKRISTAGRTAALLPAAKPITTAGRTVARLPAVKRIGPAGSTVARLLAGKRISTAGRIVAHQTAGKRRCPAAAARTVTAHVPTRGMQAPSVTKIDVTRGKKPKDTTGILEGTHQNALDLPRTPSSSTCTTTTSSATVA